MPYDYLRVDPYGIIYVIFGGEDVKTGQEEDTNHVFQRLTERLHRRAQGHGAASVWAKW
jgi:hypothetical protein